MLTSPLRQTCSGCGDEIDACTPFERDSRDGPWHPRCLAVARGWLADANAKIADLQAALAAAARWHTIGVDPDPEMDKPCVLWRDGKAVWAMADGMCWHLSASESWGWINRHNGDRWLPLPEVTP